MKILFTNFFLHKGTGTETFLITLIEYLLDKGADVSIFCIFKGAPAKTLEEKGVKVYTVFGGTLLPRLNRIPIIKYLVWGYIYLYGVIGKYFIRIPNNFDIVHFQHNSTIRILFKRVRYCKKVQFSHGVGSQEEEFHNSIYPMDAYGCMSEEVYEQRIKGLQKGTKCEVFRNPIDLKKYIQQNDVNDRLQSILVISKKLLLNKEAKEQLIRICNELGVKLSLIGNGAQRVVDTKPYIDAADLVIGLGRCAYEAMAMGRVVIIYDYLGMDGMIDSKEKFLKLRRKNLSGRYYNNRNITDQELKNELLNYNKHYGKLSRNMMEKYNGDHALEEIYDFYKRIINDIKE